MTDDLVHPLFAADYDAPPPAAPAKGSAYGDGWTEAQGAAGRARIALLVRQVIAAMPPPAVREIPSPAPPEVPEATAFEAAVAALVDADHW